MIKNVLLKQKNNNNANVSLTWSVDGNRVSIDIIGSEDVVFSELSVIIDFKKKISSWRNYDYKWVECDKVRIANYYSPKILKLSDDTKVVASQTHGLWHFDPDNKNRLIWIFADKWLTPAIQFDDKGKRIFLEPTLRLKDVFPVLLLLTKGQVTEWSRSKYPFSSILTFTDHCDFDSKILLKGQRELFDRNNITTTKGLFFYHFSKRDFNTSLENDKEEYELWKEQGHELACHSLTQSIRQKKEEWQKDFNDFLRSDHKVSTWIDHGYQPYNFTTCFRRDLPVNDWLITMERRGIKYVWTYLDSGTSGKNTLNQLDFTEFTPGNKLSEFRSSGLKDRLMSIARYIFLFHSNERYAVAYRKVTGIIRKKSAAMFLKNIFDVILVLWRSVYLYLFWNKVKNKPSDVAKYSPVIFNISDNTKIKAFQTVEVSDFRETFSVDNLQKFTERAGLCIAHTYFSVLLPHHKGRIFVDDTGKLNDGISEAFTRLSSLIKEKEIWNPTLEELGDHFSLFEGLKFTFDEKGNVVPEKEIREIHFRTVVDG